MVSSEFINDATRVYLESYNTALKITKNPSMAIQVAQAIVFSYMIVFKPETEKQQMPIDIFMKTVMKQVGDRMVESDSKKEEKREVEQGKMDKR